MSRYTGQSSSQSDVHPDEPKLAILTQQNKRLLRDMKPIEVSHNQNQHELKILLYTAQQLKRHYFSVELLSLHNKASKVSRIPYLSYLIEIYKFNSH